jgi:hypothetical protein
MDVADPQLQELLDKQGITDVICGYARSMDRLDRDLGRSVFWPEATADYYQQMYQGTGYGFVDMVMDAHPNCTAHSYQFSNILITVDGDTATSETYGDVTLRRHWTRTGGASTVATSAATSTVGRSVGVSGASSSGPTSMTSIRTVRQPAIS